MTLHTFCVKTTKKNKKNLWTNIDTEESPWRVILLPLKSVMTISTICLSLAISAPCELQEQTKDDHKHDFPPLHVVEGNYLEQDKEKTGGNLYHIDYKRKDLISVFCVVEIVCHHQQFRGEEVKMFLVNHDMHQKLCEIVNTE